MFTNKILIFLLFLSSNGIQLSSSAPYIRNTYEQNLIAKIVGYRLPTNTAPRHYRLAIEPHMEDEEFSFNGKSSIHFEVLNPTSTVVFHASEFIEIDASYTKLKYPNESLETPVAQKWNPDLEFYSVRFPSLLYLGNYTLELAWKGHPITDDGEDVYDGFYRTIDKRKYIDNTYVAITHFQATSARSAFPCWDEPALKAEYDIAIRHHPNYTALSNMPVKEVTDAEDEKVWTVFEPTPLMSTYLVAFAVAPYDKLSADNGSVTLWAPEERLNLLRVPFEISRLIPVAMERYTGMPYSLPTMGGIVMPIYGSMAIENWGLIAYSTGLFYNPEHGERSLTGAISLAAHEIVHQWFGNLVTPAWWDDLWLSEAFASYFSMKMLDHVLHGWNSEELFAVITMNRVCLSTDGRHPIRYPIKWAVETQNEIDEIFNYVTYDVGAAVLRMLENVLTEKIFQNGIRKYLQKHQFSSVTTDDLWESFQEAYDEKHSHSHLNIKELMDPWVKQPYYPVLNVTRDYITGFVTITQSHAADPKSKDLWMIPVNYATKTQPSFESTEPTHWMRRANESLTLYGIDKDDWIILNIQQTGFYRVNYDLENWQRIIAFLNTDKFDEIHVINRAQILYDLVQFIPHDQRYLELALDALPYLHRETNYLPWSRLTNELKFIVMTFQNTAVFDMFKQYALYLLNGIVNHIGFDDRLDDDHLTRMARRDLLPWACKLSHKECIARAPTKLMEIFSGKAKMFDPSAKDWIYCAGLRYANETIWNMVMDAHFANPREQDGYAYLGCTNNQVLITKYLKLALANNATVLCDEVAAGIRSLIYGPGNNFNLALNYWIGNIDEIREYFESRQDEDQLGRINNFFASYIGTESQYEKFTSFVRQQVSIGKIENDAGRRMILTAGESKDIRQQAPEMFNAMIQKRPHLRNILYNVHGPRFDYESHQ